LKYLGVRTSYWNARYLKLCDTVSREFGRIGKEALEMDLQVHHNGSVSVSGGDGVVPVNITLKNVPKELYQLLKQSADANTRSINGEAIACLSKVLRPSQGLTPELLEDIRLFRQSLGPIDVKPGTVRAAIKQGRM
jgi:antitoxin FitA